MCHRASISCCNLSKNQFWFCKKWGTGWMVEWMYLKVVIRVACTNKTFYPQSIGSFSTFRKRNPLIEIWFPIKNAEMINIDNQPQYWMPSTFSLHSIIYLFFFFLCFYLNSLIMCTHKPIKKVLWAYGDKIKVYVTSSTQELIRIHNMYLMSSTQELVGILNLRQSLRRITNEMYQCIKGMIDSIITS